MHKHKNEILKKPDCNWDTQVHVNAVCDERTLSKTYLLSHTVVHMSTPKLSVKKTPQGNSLLVLKD